jgi:hypothetical protein
VFFVIDAVFVAPGRIRMVEQVYAQRRRAQRQR